jgi:Zn-dependent M16 (insulinase) family peptidase
MYSPSYIFPLLTYQQIAQFATRQNSLRLAITCGSESVSDNERAVRKFVDSLPIAETPQRTTALFDFEAPTKALFPLPYQVSYTAMCLKTVPYTHKDGAALQMLSQLLTHKHLHHEIREKGGAYGGGAFHRGTGGIFGFYSYRDPNVANTLKVMEGAGEYALQKHWTERDLEEAKLSVFQGVDAPMSVSEEGMIYFLDGISDEMRQAYVAPDSSLLEVVTNYCRRREQLLDVSVPDIRQAAQKYLINQIKAGKTAVAVLGESKDMYDEQWNIFPLSLDPQTSTGASQFEKVTL